MSYARNTHRETYDCRYAEANAEHFSQPGVRWKWQEVVRFMKSVLFDPITGDPTGNDYGNQTGGLRFEASTNRFRYKGASSTDATVQWRYFGSGDGDVSYFGTEQADNGVARWHSVTRQIQGSRATLDDNGNFETDGRYATTQGSDFDDAFKATVVGDSEPMYLVRANGQTLWGPGGATPVDTDLTRLGVNHLGSDEPGAYFSLREGDSRIAAQRHLGGLGNSQGTSNYRCPVVLSMLPRAESPSYGSSSLGVDLIETAYSFDIPPNALPVGDQVTVVVVFETASSALVKRFGVKIDSLSIACVINVAGGDSHHGRVVITILREDTSTLSANVVGNSGAGGLSITPIDANNDFSTSYNAASPVTVEVIGAVVGDGSAISNAQWIVKGGKVVFYNL